VLIVAPPTSEAAMREVVTAAEGGRLVILGVLAPTSMQALRAVVGRGSAAAMPDAARARHVVPRGLCLSLAAAPWWRSRRGA
jgi:hypothetical protein